MSHEWRKVASGKREIKGTPEPSNRKILREVKAVKGDVEPQGARYL